MKLTSTQFVELQKCKSPQEVIEKAKAQGIEMTLQEAEVLLVKPSIIELDENSLTSVSGGNELADHVSDVCCRNCGQRAKYINSYKSESYIMHYYVCGCGYETVYSGDEFIYYRPIGRDCNF